MIVDRGRHLQRHQLSLSLTILAVVMWSLSLTQAKLTIGFYGLIHSYTVIYFIALGLLSIASFMLWTAREDHGKLLCLQLCLFITVLWLTPVLIGGNPVSTVWTYAALFPNSDYITKYAQIEPALMVLQNWPGSYILESTIMNIAGVNTADFMAFFSPLLMQFLILPPLYVFFKHTVSVSNHRWAACWVFFLANWTAQIYLDPQAFGLLLLITLLALIIRNIIWGNGVTSIGHPFGSILLMAGLTIFHFLTSAVAFLSLATFWVTRKFQSVNLIAIAIVFIAAWSMYGATAQFEFNVPRYVERAFRLDLVFRLSALTSSGMASESFMGIAYVRYAFTALFSAIAVVGFFLSFKFRDKADTVILFLLLPAFFVLFSMLYGSEYWVRTYLFALLPMAYFSVKMLKTRVTAIIFCLLMLLALPLNTIAHYGFATVDYQPPGEIAYWHFARDNTMPGDVLGGTRIFYPGYTYSKYYMEKATWEKGMFKPSTKDRPQYIHVGEVDNAAYKFYQTDFSSAPETKTRLEQSPYYSLIYNNPAVNLYIHEDTK